jgi:signal transduction histidine kinase
MRDIVARIDSLSELINDLMVFARPRPPRLAIVELHAILADAFTIVRRDPAAHGIEISVQGEDVSVTADGEMVRATVLNLLLNAAQAMAGRGRITVRTSRQDGLAVVQISDTGPESLPRSASKSSNRSSRRRRAAAAWDCRLHGAPPNCMAAP